MKFHLLAQRLFLSRDCTVHFSRADEEIDTPWPPSARPQRDSKCPCRLLSDYDTVSQRDAVLLIGDRAIDFQRATHVHEIFDLGTAWYELTNLPFVYAVWALRRGIENKDLCRNLREAKKFGLETLDYVIETREEYDEDFRRDYLGWHVHYHLAEDEKRGIAKFAELLQKHGLGPVFEPKFV